MADKRKQIKQITTYHIKIFEALGASFDEYYYPSWPLDPKEESEHFIKKLHYGFYRSLINRILSLYVFDTWDEFLTETLDEWRSRNVPKTD